ncbi:hypothetical protein DICVIV_01910 [Dictyocaulus viviparus]|uniref:Uncharacterized protein n=1 Tax=Dictyocaulus viviparus TaxID=29172 RepID=A0A0D8Y7H5_DICVI|nr:hypothetical protein DICVIV_01910 [Dictyocaulus viviparus]
MRMIFDVPKLEDLNFEFSLDKTECVFTVRKYKEFNDSLAKKLFPRSSADYIPSDTYTLPDRLETVVRTEGEKDWNVVKCMASVVALIDMCKWMLAMCWEGDRSKPPMPLYLYKARLCELKDACLLGVQCLQNLSSCWKDGEIIEVSNIPQQHKTGVSESRNSQSELDKQTQWKLRYMEHIGRISSTLDKIANAGENVEEALACLMEIRQCINDGQSCREDISDKLKILNEEIVLREKKIDERPTTVIHKSGVSIPMHNALSSNVDTEDNSNEPVQISHASRRNITKRGRRILNDSEDDLVSRVKRGQRTRRPTRTFTPLWTLSPSPPPTNKTTPSSKSTSSAVKITSPLVKRTSPHTSSITPTLCSPDSGRPSSNESGANVVASTNDVAVHKNDAVNVEKSTISLHTQHLPEQFLPNRNTSFGTTTTSSVPTLMSSTNFSSQISSLSLTATSKPPCLTLDEQSLLALWKEKIKLGDVRITLLNMLGADGTSQFHFIPLMVETIDKATAALDNKDMIAYAMHRDPASQIASLATAMGLNPAPFASMIQPSALPTGLNHNILVDLHEAASIVAGREQMAGSYALPPQSLDPMHGYAERDISNYLL